MKPRYQQVAKLEEWQAAYIAGLIDGEGTITLTRKHANENKHLALTISSTELPMLEFVLRLLVVGKITNKRRYAEHHRKSYTYAVYNRQALEVLRQIERFLLSYKRRRCELATREYLQVTPRNGKYSAEALVRRRQFEKTFLRIKPTT